MLSHIRRYLISGLLVWIPIIATLLVLKVVVDLLSKSLLLLPTSLQPDVLFGFHLPGIGVVLTLVIILGTGVFAANFLGEKMVSYWERFLARIPIVRPIYAGVKQVTETLFKPNGQSFRKVLLVEFPRAGVWSIAFQTGEANPEIEAAIGEEKIVTFFIPTTPNPTSGFLMMAPKSKVKELEMSVDQALKFVISLGVVLPTPPGIIIEKDIKDIKEQSH